MLPPTAKERWTGAMNSSGIPLLAASGIRKSYGGVEVLHGVDFELNRGECAAVVGENGAGKSTFAKIITGAVTPDAGHIQIDGQRVQFTSPRVALKHGIGLIPQELAYVPELTVAENILIGRWPSRGGWTSGRSMVRRALAEAAEFGVELNPTAKMRRLKLADQQVVEIVKALGRDAKLIVLDEPTAPLTAHESSQLFDVVRRLLDRGVGIIYISHRLDELPRVSDRVDVLRNGSRVWSGATQATTPKLLIEQMLGRSAHELSIGAPPARNDRPFAELRNWSATGSPTIDDVSLSVWRGEVVVLFGVRGSGSETVAEGLGGKRRDISGSLRIAGADVELFKSPRDALRSRIGYVPSDRKKDGLVLSQTIEENVGLLMLRPLSRLGVVSKARRRALAVDMTARFDIRATGPTQMVRALSGGNQQKVLVSSRLAPGPEFLVLHEPTRGVDVGARLQLHAYLRQIAGGGNALLVITSDVEEAVAISDRLIVIRDGRIAAELEGHHKTQAGALEAAAGQETESA